VVESQPSKLLVAGSIPVSRSRFLEVRQTRELVAAKNGAVISRGVLGITKS
jgi:hypothetical protein